MNRITTLFHLVYNQFLHSICTYNLESLINFLNNLAIILSQYPNSSLAFYIQILHKLFSLFNPQHSRVFDVILLVNHPFIRWFSRVYTTGYPCCDFCYFLEVAQRANSLLGWGKFDFLGFIKDLLISEFECNSNILNRLCVFAQNLYTIAIFPLQIELI